MGPAAVVVLPLMLAAAALVVFAFRSAPPNGQPAPRSPTHATAAVASGTRPRPTFVGEASCAGCHRDESEAWRDSQHARAMRPVAEGTVLGDFDDARFTHAGVTSTFFRKDGRYLVRTDGPDGKLADFEIAYTFGVYPMQQYLIPFPDGRMQALTIAWDARPRAGGGQRWFHLYPDEPADHRDALHWTAPAQNWNYGCADCHSTNLRRNYDAARDRYATTWSDVSVACEACHGPGSEHVAWAERRPGTEHLAAQGLAVALDERRGVEWLPTANGNAARSRALTSHREVETCAACHARRSPLGDEPGPTGRLLDTYRPAVLEARLYHPDGQQLAEVYTYGSFLQSKMYARGVTCSDCHDPHTERLRADGNAVCARCHAPATYETPGHLLHAAGSAGAKCVACHMPTTTYMLIDPRHDHSLRIPRPDLTIRYAVPNACASCHADRGAAWAADVIEKAHGPTRKGFQTFVGAITTARAGAPGALDALTALVRDQATPAIVRATALHELPRFAGAAMLATISGAVADGDPLVRLAALDALAAVPPPLRAPLAESAADDRVKGVRVEAGRMLAGAPPATLSPARRAARETAMAEYVASETATAERPESHANLGTFYAEQGDAERAEAEYRAAIRRETDFVPAYANLADLFRARGRDADAAAVLEQGLAAVPDDPTLLHALGLTRVREHRLSDALPLLARASAARPDDARFAYVYGVALHDAGRGAEALRTMRAALERSPYDPDLLSGLATFAREAGDRDGARAYARRLVAVAPSDQGAAELLRSLD